MAKNGCAFLFIHCHECSKDLCVLICADACDINREPE